MMTILIAFVLGTVAGAIALGIVSGNRCEECRTRTITAEGGGATPGGDVCLDAHGSAVAPLSAGECDCCGMRGPRRTLDLHNDIWHVCATCYEELAHQTKAWQARGRNERPDNYF